LTHLRCRAARFVSSAASLRRVGSYGDGVIEFLTAVVIALLDIFLLMSCEKFLFGLLQLSNILFG